MAREIAFAIMRISDCAADGGISFRGVIAFIFADLLVLPILNIYRKYYGAQMMWFTLGTYYVAMAVAALVGKLVFDLFGLIAQYRGRACQSCDQVQLRYGS